MLRHLYKLIACLSVACAPVAPTSADDASDPFARDLLILTDWFEGEFDNEEQIWFHHRSGADGEPPIRIHTIHKRVNMPVLGDHVFYVEEYRDHNPANIIRQRLVVFSSDLEENAIRVKQGFFKDAASIVGGHHSPEKIENLSEDAVWFMDACDVFLRRDVDQFEGGMKAKACVFGEGAERRYSVHNLAFSENKFWRTDQTFLVADDSFYSGTPINAPTKLRRSTPYICAFRFYDEDRNEQLVADLKVFSQGGTATAIRESDGASFDILIREKEYPYYDTRPDFMYYSIRRTGEQRSIAYGVADANSRQFGAFVGDMSVFCHREGYAFRESLEAIRLNNTKE